MSKYTAEQVDAFILEQENHTFVREDFNIEAAMDYLHDYAAHLREREAAKAVACRVCGSHEPHTGTCGSNDPRALCNATVAPMLASARVPDGWREFLENLATPMSEPLNSCCGYRNKDARRHFMGNIRAKARELLAAAPKRGEG